MSKSKWVAIDRPRILAEWVETSRRFEALVVKQADNKPRSLYLAVLERVMRVHRVDGKDEWRESLEYGQLITAEGCEELGIDLALGVAHSATVALGKQLARGEDVKKRAEKHAKK